SCGQPRVGRRAAHDGHAGNAFTCEPLGQTVEIGAGDVLGVHCAARADTPRQTDGVVAITRAYVGNPHPGFDAHPIQHAGALAAPASTRAASVEYAGVMSGATGRSAFGNCGGVCACVAPTHASIASQATASRCQPRLGTARHTGWTTPRGRRELLSISRTVN